VDRVASGEGTVLIDYKTHAPSLETWTDKRPDQPQLPLYAITAGEPVVAVAFAQLLTGEPKFRGYGESARIPGVVPLPMNADGEARSFEEQLVDWRRVLSALAVEFREGVAVVDPKSSKVCNECHLETVCRIAEVRSSAEAKAEERHDA
jgi:hypothetical protein